MKNFWHTLPRPILALAPMEGVNDKAFRQLCKQHGADLVYTEFVSADAIAHNARKALERLRFDPKEQPVIAQIFGHDLKAFVIAAKLIERLGFAGLDINFGCPARKVVAHGSGVALLRNPQYARQLIEVALDSVSIPVSIKVRTRIRKERKEVAPGMSEYYKALDLLEAIHDLPISAIMVHGRSYEQGHQGDVDTDMIRAIKQNFSGLVLANGGIFSPERVATILQETGADGVGIARGSWGTPWIFRQSRELLMTGAYTPAGAADVVNTIRQHAALLVATKGGHGLIEFRKHFAKYVAGRPGAAALRAQAVRVENLAGVEQIITQLQSQLVETV